MPRRSWSPPVVTELLLSKQSLNSSMTRLRNIPLNRFSRSIPSRAARRALSSLDACRLNNPKRRRSASAPSHPSARPRPHAPGSSAHRPQGRSLRSAAPNASRSDASGLKCADFTPFTTGREISPPGHPRSRNAAPSSQRCHPRSRNAAPSSQRLSPWDRSPVTAARSSSVHARHLDVPDGEVG